MLPQWTMVGFTGHRELADPTSALYHIQNALNRLEELCGPLAAVSSVAQGADLLFLDEATRRNLPLWIFLPFARARFDKNFTADQLKHIHSQLNSALQIEEISEPATDDEAYMEVGEKIVEHADVLLAVWDGKPAAGLGGSADVVALARKLKKPIIWINPSSGLVLEEWLHLLSPKPNIKLGYSSSKEIVVSYFEEKDNLARKIAPTARYLVQQIILLHLFASAVGLVVPVFGLSQKPRLEFLEYFFAGVELLLLSAVFLLIAAHRRRHRDWVQSRFEAEICRSFIGTWQIRRRTGHSFKLTVPGFNSLCKKLRLLQSLDKTPPPALADAIEYYVETRLNFQIKYFRERASEAKTNHDRLKTVALICTSSAALLVVILILITWSNVHGWPEQLARLFSLVLPMASAAIFSLVLTMEYSRRADQYQQVKALLENTVERLKLVQTWNGLIRIAVETEDQLIREIVEWNAYRRFVATSH